MRDRDEKWDVMKLLVGFVLQHPSFKGIWNLKFGLFQNTHPSPPLPSLPPKPTTIEEPKHPIISYIIWSHIVGPMQLGLWSHITRHMVNLI